MLKDPPTDAGDIGDMGLIPWFRKIPWRRARQPTAAFLPGKFHGQRNLAGSVRPESDTTEVTSHAHSQRAKGKNCFMLLQRILAPRCASWGLSGQPALFPGTPRPKRTELQDVFTPE